MLTIRDLHASVQDKPILKGINLTIRPGEVHAIMGPNGSGKSTLASVLAGHEGYQVTKGHIAFAGQPLLPLNVEERAQAGLFLAFQYPMELPGVGNSYFIKTALNSVRKARGLPELDAVAFLKQLKQRMALLECDSRYKSRFVNVGFSGGEKKRNDMLQMLMLDPKLAILDETDSGLDIDALRIVAQGVNARRDGERSFLLITHYERLLEHIKPDHVHVLVGGQIVQSGDASLATHLETHGYNQVEPA